ncbi:MAG: tyrosine-protein phosphatase [Nioella sp.]
MRGIGQRLSDWKAQYNVVPVCPRTEARAQIYVNWFDHGFARQRWTNADVVAPGVIRSNHPTRARLEVLAAAGLKSVLSLRGAKPTAHYHLEVKACRELGLAFVPVGLSDRRAPRPEHFRMLIGAFHSIEKPFLMHCKAGADRAGLAAAIYLIEIEGRPFAEARGMLSARYGHLRRSKAGILDAVLDAYGHRLALGPISVLDWAETEYDPQAITGQFKARRRFRQREEAPGGVPAMH